MNVLRPRGACCSKFTISPTWRGARSGTSRPLFTNAVEQKVSEVRYALATYSAKIGHMADSHTPAPGLDCRHGLVLRVEVRGA